MTINLEQYFRDKAEIINKALDEFLGGRENLLRPIMEYSVLSEGKRFRPILVLAALESLGGDCTRALPAACAVEIIHCFSLVHDDLPCMDNDDYRRGHLSTHKKFGEAEALLTGDALVMQAFEILSRPSDTAWTTPEKKIEVIFELSSASGAQGMTGGQYLELTKSTAKVDESLLAEVHRLKTGASIRCAVRIGGILGDASPQDLDALTAYGESIGLLFQIVDDILDAGKDDETISFSSFYGMAEARNKACEAAEQAREALARFSGKKELFTQIIDFLLERKR
ncbi:MAG: polyprenyl synthetase family protein [Vulcanimicrobiota bacterium]